jgi:capsule biosynthesis phosphatase
MNKIYCIDLDDTICFPNHEFSDTYKKYMEAKPNFSVINKINSLYDNKNEIIIFTARRMLTHNGDLEKILADVEDVTKNWLKKFDVKYHKLIFGKPYADFYIDDKAVELKNF